MYAWLGTAAVLPGGATAAELAHEQLAVIEQRLRPAALPSKQPAGELADRTASLEAAAQRCLAGVSALRHILGSHLAPHSPGV